jgi:tripartite-type tricarboxylate transporter receptor subunit TctC
VEEGDVVTSVKRGLWTVVAVVLTVAAWTCAPVWAQGYPDKPIKLVLPYPPGASTDTLGRLIGQKIGERLGQPVIAENRSGASGVVGSSYVAKAAPDGYTILLGTAATHATNQFLSAKYPFDPVADFTPIIAAARNVIVLVVNPSFGVNTVGELLLKAKAMPEGIAYGTSGTGSPHHLAGELLRQLTGIKLIHVPYKGGGSAVQDLLGGQIPMMFASLVAVESQVRAGRLRVLGVTGSAPYKNLPGVPPIGQTIKGFELTSWLGFFGPAGMPSAIVKLLNQEIARALASPDVIARLDLEGMEILGGSPEQFAATIRADQAKNSKLIRDAGIQPE